MNVVDYVLDGLEQWLEVERECGVRTLKVDRSLLSPVAKPTSKAASAVGAGSPRTSSPPSASSASRMSSSSSPSSASAATYDYVFLHDSPLSPAGIEMMAKIVTAMGRTAETAPVIIEPPLPRARAYIVLGSYALKKYFPGMKGGPGNWTKTADGTDVLITYSPTHILRFSTVDESVMRMKREMWASLKVVMQKFNGGKDGR